MDTNDETPPMGTPLPSFRSEVSATITEAEYAAKFKERFEAALLVVCDLMDEARANGLNAAWGGMGTNHLGRTVPVGIQLTKHY